ncbi:MAG TPA: 2-dehydro-3-deoxy-6-phosphogalactonate aldolase [Burkholderiales bacterium]|nr:2-dehydro-3-deoxy-6-phosphogalactonate aldolase [Burkholderiales bacterium]
MLTLQQALSSCPLVAILRGIRPDACQVVGEALVENGFTIIEVPLNSPRPFESIAILSASLGDRALIGAGTVLRAEQVHEVARCAGRLVVMPHTDVEVVKEAKQLGMHVIPGFATPSEAFGALGAGADALKLFPAEANPPAVLKALRAVLPKEVDVLPVGSITPDNMSGYWAAGANGFGLGSALYKPDMDLAKIREAAARFRRAIDQLRASRPT